MTGPFDVLYCTVGGTGNSSLEFSPLDSPDPQEQRIAAFNFDNVLRSYACVRAFVFAPMSAYSALDNCMYVQLPSRLPAPPSLPPSLSLTPSLPPCLPRFLPPNGGRHAILCHEAARHKALLRIAGTHPCCTWRNCTWRNPDSSGQDGGGTAHTFPTNWKPSRTNKSAIPHADHPPLGNICIRDKPIRVLTTSTGVALGL